MPRIINLKTAIATTASLAALGAAGLANAPSATAMPGECEAHYHAAYYALYTGDWEWSLIELRAYRACLDREGE